MGLDRKLFISNRWEVQNVKELLETRLKVQCKIQFHDFAPNYVVLAFKYQDEDRRLNIHQSSELSGFVGTLLSLGHWGKSEEILTLIANSFGGFYCPMDSEDNYIQYNSPLDSSYDRRKVCSKK